MHIFTQKWKLNIFFFLEISLCESTIMLCTLLCFTKLIIWCVECGPHNWHLALPSFSQVWSIVSSPPAAPTTSTLDAFIYSMSAICALYSTPNYTGHRKARTMIMIKAQKIQGAWCYSPISIHLCLAVCCLECQYFQCLSWSSLLFSSPNTTITTLWKKHFFINTEILL